MRESIKRKFKDLKKKDGITFVIYIILNLFLACSLYAISMSCFVNSEGSNLITSGVGGIAIILSRYVLPDLGVTLDQNILFSIFYVLMNVPLFFIAYKNIGKLFAVLTLSNVILSSVLISLIDPHMWDFLEVSNMEDLTIALFSGIFTGLAMGFALKGNFSTGGTDIISLTMSIKKGLSFGKYQMVFNGIIMLFGGIASKNWNAILYTFVYIGVSSYVVDLIHTRNRKVMLEVVSTKGEEICELLLRESHHGITVLEATGAYTKEKKNVLHLVVSSFQITEIVAPIKNIDESSFILQVPVSNIYGRFYIPPFK